MTVDQNEIFNRLGAIEGKITTLLDRDSDRKDALAGYIVSNNERVTHVEYRVTRVETQIYRAVGVGSGLTLAGAVVAWLVKLVFVAPR